MLYTHIADAASQAAMQRLAGANQNQLERRGARDGRKESDRGSAQDRHKPKEERDDGSVK